MDRTRNFEVADLPFTNLESGSVEADKSLPLEQSGHVDKSPGKALSKERSGVTRATASDELDHAHTGMLRLAKDWSSRICQTADLGIRQVALDEIRCALVAGSESEIESALRALVAAAEVDFERDGFRELVKAYLQEERADLRLGALQAFGTLEPTKEDYWVVAPLLEDPDPSVRAMMGWVVTQRIGGRQVTGNIEEAIIQLLADQDTSVVKGVVGGLGGCELSEGLVDRLLEMYSNDASQRCIIASALGRSPQKGEKAISTLLEATTSADGELRSTAFSGLRFGVPDERRREVAEWMLTVIRECADPDARNSAMVTLSWIGDESDVAVVDTLLANPLLGKAERDRLSYALGKMRERLGQ